MLNSPFKLRCGFALAILCSYISITGAQVPVGDEISVDSSIVVLNAVVNDPQSGVKHGYGISDFLLFEDGIRQTIDFVDPESSPFAAVILLDVSGSMEQRISLSRSAAIRFLDGIRTEDHVAIYSFDRKVKLVQDFSNSKNLRSRVFDLEARGNTALYDAVHRAATVLKERKEKRRAIVVLSDGEDTRSGYSASKALKAAQAADATIYTVDMSPLGRISSTRRQNRAVLKKFASKTGGVFVSTPGGIQLRTAFANIVKELGVQYTIGYHSTNQDTDGKWREIDLRSSSEGVTIRTREGYYSGRGKSN